MDLLSLYAQAQAAWVSATLAIMDKLETLGDCEEGEPRASLVPAHMV